VRAVRTSWAATESVSGRGVPSGTSFAARGAHVHNRHARCAERLGRDIRVPGLPAGPEDSQRRHEPVIENALHGGERERFVERPLEGNGVELNGDAGQCFVVGERRSAPDLLLGQARRGRDRGGIGSHPRGSTRGDRGVHENAHAPKDLHIVVAVRAVGGGRWPYHRRAQPSPRAHAGRHPQGRGVGPRTSLGPPGGMAQVSFPMTDQAPREGSLPASGRLPFVASRPDSHVLQMERS
jgi:hypothetical protein